MADAKLKFQKGDNEVFKPGNNSRWRNGEDYCSLIDCYNDKDQCDHVALLFEDCEDWEKSSRYYEVKIVNNKPTVTNRKGFTVEHLVAGQWDLLVVRNASGAVVETAIKSDGTVGQDAQDYAAMIEGVYVGSTATNAKDTVVFGAISGERLDFLPGTGYDLRYIDPENNFKRYDRYLITYAPERMKRVSLPRLSTKVDDKGVTHYYGNGAEISKSEYDFIASRPAGYGGNASLHGPLLWWVKPQGCDLSVELYEPFEESLDAYYSNYRDPKFTLKWVRSPYKSKERWAVLSYRPLTRGMLTAFDKATQQLMLNYLNSRKAPTALESLNKSLLGTVLGVTGKGMPTKKSTTGKSKSRKSRK